MVFLEASNFINLRGNFEMKKLLLTSAVLVGMGASQAFAADSDSWNGTVNLAMPNTCVLPDPTVSLNGTPLSARTTVGGTAAFTTTIDTDGNGLANDTIDLDILFNAQTFCNYGHSLRFVSQHNGFIANNGTSALSAGTDSDAFLLAIPHALTITGWHSTANALNWSEGAANTYANAAPATDALWEAISTRVDITDDSIPAFHNDALAGTGSGPSATTGLNFSLDYAGTSNSGVPLLAGTYTDRFYLKIGQTL